MNRRRPIKYQTGGRVPVYGPTNMNVNMPIEARQPRMRKKDRQLLEGLKKKYNYSPDMPIYRTDESGGKVNRRLNRIQLGPSNAQYDPGSTLGHELGHTLHKGTFDREYLNKIVNEEADRIGASDEQRQRMLSMMKFDETQGENYSKYLNAPQEKFGRMAGASLGRITGTNPYPEDMKNLLGEEELKNMEFEDAVMGRMLNEAEEFGLGGFIENNLGTIGTALGAGVGTLAGGNTALGAKLGGMAGNMGQKALSEEEYELPNRRPMNTAKSTTASMAYGGSTKKYKGGGYSTPIGQDAQQFVGPKHEKGGVPLNKNIEVEGGETMDNVEGSGYIFSDRLTVPEYIRGKGTGAMTFADYHKQLVEENAPPSEIQELADAQEQVSGRETGDPTDNPIRYKHGGKTKYRYGGRTRPTKYATGGGLDDGRSVGVERMRVQPQEINLNLPTMAMADQVNSSISRNQGTDYTQLARKGLNYLPAAMNLTRGLLEDSDVSDVPYTPPAGRGEETIQQMETDVNVRPQLGSVDRNLRGVMADPNATMNQKLAASSQASRQRAQIQNQAEMQENQLENQQTSTLARMQSMRDRAISQGRTQSDRATRQQQMKADEAQNRLIQTGLQQAATTYQKQKAYEDALKSDRIKFQTMISSLPDSAARNDILRRLMKKYPEERSRLQALMVPETETNE